MQALTQQCTFGYIFLGELCTKYLIEIYIRTNGLSLRETAIFDILSCILMFDPFSCDIFFYLIGILVYRFKIFAPITLLAFIVLVPVNWTGKTLEAAGDKNLTYSDIDKISISNIPFGSDRLDLRVVPAEFLSLALIMWIINKWKKLLVVLGT